MPNERLRAALLQRGATPADLAEEIGVDAKSVERWITQGRLWLRRHAQDRRRRGADDLVGQPAHSRQERLGEGVGTEAWPWIAGVAVVVAGAADHPDCRPPRDLTHG